MVLSEKDKKLIQEYLFVLKRLKSAFESRVKRVQNIDVDTLNSFEEREPIDAFLDRFERLVDFSFQRVFRFVYKLENRQEPASLLQLTSFLVKRGFVDDEDFLISLKDLRNRIAHEYIGIGIYNIKEFVQEIIENFFKFKLVIDAVETYLGQVGAD